jgi:hypothetical protein
MVSYTDMGPLGQYVMMLYHMLGELSARPRKSDKSVEVLRCQFGGQILGPLDTFLGAGHFQRHLRFELPGNIRVYLSLFLSSRWLSCDISSKELRDNACIPNSDV